MASHVLAAHLCVKVGYDSYSQREHCHSGLRCLCSHGIHQCTGRTVQALITLATGIDNISYINYGKGSISFLHHLVRRTRKYALCLSVAGREICSTSLLLRSAARTACCTFMSVMVVAALPCLNKCTLK